MIYVLDSNVFSQLFKSYYPDQFPTLWRKFGKLVTAERVTSTLEVQRELEDWDQPGLKEWLKNNSSVFPSLSFEEALKVREIFAVSQFQQSVERKKLLRGGRNADAFLVARAMALKSERSTAVVTLERKKKNAVTIPNICEYFDVRCMSLQQLMFSENWRF